MAMRAWSLFLRAWSLLLTMRCVAADAPIRCVACNRLVGNLNESSLRLSNELEEGHEVARGQRLACFAGGGSGAALLLFDAAVELAEACAEAHAQGLPFRLDAGAGLAVPCANAAGAEESRARG